MKKILRPLFSSVILLALVFYFHSTFQAEASVLWNLFRSQVLHVPPCSDPIPYSIGTFDTQFKISQDYFLSALADAEAIWEKPMGKQLFIYNPNYSGADALKINLVYDYRQEATSKLASLGIVFKDNKASYDSLKANFLSMQNTFNSMKAIYETDSANFNQQKKAYEDQVNYWNARGGAPSAEYNKLQNQKAALDLSLVKLQSEQTKVNEMVSQINSMVVVLNRLADTLNLSVTKYNTTNGSRGESFEEGVYVSDGLSQHIDIYEFSDRAKLVRVLAHELGHALGLDHVNDPKAIMYKLNQGNNESLTSADVTAVKTKCQIK